MLSDGQPSQEEVQLRVGLTARAISLANAYKSTTANMVGRRPFLTLFSAGALSVLAMAPFHAWPVLFFTLPVLFWAIDETSPDLTAGLRRAAWRGWAFGFGYHLAGLYWIGFSFLVQAEQFAVLMPFAVSGLTAALGLFFVAAAVAFAFVRHRLPPGMPRILVLAFTVMVAEWLRGHILTGFPWNILGYALTMPLPLMQWAGLFGIYVLTAVTVITLTAPLVVLAKAPARPWHMIGATTIAPLVFAMTYGIWQLNAHPTVHEKEVRLRLVQPSFSQKDKFIEAKRGPIFLRHLELSSQGFEPGSKTPLEARPTHIIWPEAAVPFFLRRNAQALAAIDRALPDDVQIITGTFRINASPDVPNDQVGTYKVFNSALAISGNGNVQSVYDKIHLVPFGEYLPAQKFLNALGLENLTRAKGGLAIGRSPRRLMQVNGLPPVAMLICYEASFPNEVVQGSARPGVLINVTNDAWFGTTSGPYQHLHQTRLRAVEQGLPMLRSANTGISAIIDPLGRIQSSLGLNEVGVIDGPLPAPVSPPLYAKHGFMIELVAIFLLLVGIWAASSKARKSD